MTEESSLQQQFLKNISNIPKFKNLFLDETDRGCALLAASLLELELEKLFARIFVTDAKLQEKLFSLNGPLATLSSRIDLCYALGLCSKKDYGRMHLVRRIRNEFGHGFEALDFATEKISQKIRAIALETHSKRHKMRTIFLDIVNKLLINIYVECLLARKSKEPEHYEINPNDLIRKKKQELKHILSKKNGG